MQRIDCVGAVVRDDAGRLLLVQRANPPAAGLWSVPGGRVEDGESDEEALVREVSEETGLRVTVGRLLGVVERAAGPRAVYVIRDYECRVAADRGATEGLGGVAGDDAAAVGWWVPDAADAPPLVPDLLDTLRDWGVLG